MKIQAVPALGAIFGILLALIVFTSAAVYRKTTELKDRFVHAQREYRRAADLLVAVRSDIYSPCSPYKITCSIPEPARALALWRRSRGREAPPMLI
jgi:hypothetical protein